MYGALQLRELGTVTLHLKDVTVEKVLSELFTGTPFEYKFEMKSIVIKKREEKQVVKNVVLSGVVTG